MNDSLWYSIKPVSFFLVRTSGAAVNYTKHRHFFQTADPQLPSLWISRSHKAAMWRHVKPSNSLSNCAANRNANQLYSASDWLGPRDSRRLKWPIRKGGAGQVRQVRGTETDSERVHRDHMHAGSDGERTESGSKRVHTDHEHAERDGERVHRDHKHAESGLHACGFWRWNDPIVCLHVNKSSSAYLKSAFMLIKVLLHIWCHWFSLW